MASIDTARAALRRELEAGIARHAALPNSRKHRQAIAWRRRMLEKLDKLPQEA